MTVLKLPKGVVSDPRHDAVASLLVTNAEPLWEGGRARVVTVPLGDALSAELRVAFTAEHACQGLELITERLAAEQKGLDAVSAKTPGSPQNARVSRLLFVANDGSTRFYRDCDALLARYPQRLLAVRLDVAGEVLGAALFGSARLVRSVLVTDKTAAARVLLAALD